MCIYNEKKEFFSLKPSVILSRSRVAFGFRAIFLQMAFGAAFVATISRKIVKNYNNIKKKLASNLQLDIHLP